MKHNFKKVGIFDQKIIEFANVKNWLYLIRLNISIISLWFSKKTEFELSFSLTNFMLFFLKNWKNILIFVFESIKYARNHKSW